MQCTEAQKLFTDFADNTLAREELHALTDHFLGCQTCGLEWREFRQTLSLVHSLETHSPPADLLPGIQAKLAQRGIFGRAWSLVETLNFSLSIPTAAAIFTIAMLGGFLLKTSHHEPATIFQSRLARNDAKQGEMLTNRRATPAPRAMLAVSHNGKRQGEDLAAFAQRALVAHLPPDDDAHRMLSPDMHVLIENTDRGSQVVFCEEMLRRGWQLHRMNTGLYLVHLPRADLGHFHELLARHSFALVPAAAAEAQFGNGKKVLTAAIRFQ
jgi:hypothetical protein